MEEGKSLLLPPPPLGPQGHLYSDSWLRTPYRLEREAGSLSGWSSHSIWALTTFLSSILVPLASEKNASLSSASESVTSSHRGAVSGPT